MLFHCFCYKYSKGSVILRDFFQHWMKVAADSMIFVYVKKNCFWFMSIGIILVLCFGFPNNHVRFMLVKVLCIELLTSFEQIVHYASFPCFHGKLSLSESSTSFSIERLRCCLVKEPEWNNRRALMPKQPVFVGSCCYQCWVSEEQNMFCLSFIFWIFLKILTF